MYIIKKIDDNDAIGKILRLGLSLYPYKWRKLNKTFTEFSQLLIANEKRSYEAMLDYQFNKTKQLVTNAYHHSTFYQQLYRSKDFNPNDLKNFNDIGKIPIIKKNDIRKHYHHLILNTYKGKILQSVTSGTSGSPLNILRDKYTANREWASICYQWLRAGYKPTDGRIEFRGVLPKNELFRHIRHEKVLRINILKLNEQNIEKIVQAISLSKYSFLHGYPSAIYIFSKLLQAKYAEKPSTINIKGILLASEIIYDWQIALIEQIFSPAKVIAHYGQAEKVALGAWNEDRAYHFIPSYSLVEFGKQNQIIGTSFVNENIPLIRYQLNDIAQEHQNTPQSNKTLYPIIKNIAGRLEDITYSNDGTPIPPAIVTFPFKNLKHIKSCRIIQKDYTNFVIEYQQISNTYTEHLKIELKELEDKFKQIYGKQSTIQFVEKKEFEGIKNGKFRWIINSMEK